MDLWELFPFSPDVGYLGLTIVNLLKNLKKNGMSIMLISHDLAILSEVAEKIGVMYGGKMVEFGTSSEIYRNPKHPYTQWT